MISTKEQLDKLPDIAKQEIATRHPLHYESLAADENKLPAELRLRMSRKELTFEDIDDLTAAGFTAAVKFLEQRKEEFMQQALDEFIQRQQDEMAANAAARGQELEQLRIASLNHSNQVARQQYIRQLHSGSSVEQPTGPVTIAG